MKKMLSFQERFGSVRDLCFNLLRLSGTYLLLGLEESAIECIQKGRKLTEEHFDSKLYLWFVLMDGYREREFGDPKRAQEFFEETSAVAGRFEDKELKNWALLGSADLAFEAGDVSECTSILKQIESQNGGEEFEIRQELLRLQLRSLEKPDASIEEAFEELEIRCEKGHLKEILWTVYHAWSKFLSRDCRRHFESKEVLSQGVQLCRSLANSLPEEYRHRYLSQSLRKKLLDDWSALSNEIVQEGSKAADSALSGFASATETMVEKDPFKERK